MKKLYITITLLFYSLCATAKTDVNHYFETIKNDPQQLLIFLQNMPKGGDLHYHLAGSGMAENMMRYAADDHLCVDRQTFALSKTAMCANADLMENTPKDSALYNAIIDAWSMRNFVHYKESGHDHFFATFGKFNLATSNHTGEILAEVAERAELQNELYLELMVTPDNNASGMLGKKIGWNADFSKLREKLLSGGLDNIVTDISKNIDTAEAKKNEILMCCNNKKAGCNIKIHYLYQILREQPPAQVFAQLLAGFEVASKDPRFVGINMVQPEDGFISMRDYKLHMQMVGFLHQLYPNVHITLHAGELNGSLVPPSGLRFHIHDAVDVAHAERIGHGVDIAYEDDADKLLKEMAQKKVMVEINLTSNAEILGVSGANHPLPLYLHYHVPVALSTDDEGVLRTDLTRQYQQAILTYHFTYPEIKNLVRNSITYSFIPGKNLWQDAEYHQVVSVCRKDGLGSVNPSSSCEAFLKDNEKAQTQWELESRFTRFEKNSKLFNSIFNQNDVK